MVYIKFVANFGDYNIGDEFPIISIESPGSDGYRKCTFDISSRKNDNWDYDFDFWYAESDEDIFTNNNKIFAKIVKE